MKTILLVVIFVLAVGFFTITSAHAAVSSFSLEKDFYTVEEQMSFIGKEQTGKKAVFVVIDNSIGEYVGMLSDPSSDTDGAFLTIARDVSLFFNSPGIYTATAFTDDQKKAEGLAVQLKFDGNKVFVVQDFILALNPIPDKTIDEKKTLTFIPTLVQSTTKVTYSLEQNPPVGASIDEQTGKFTWTPTETQGPGQYVFDIVVKKGGLQDREFVKITVTDAFTSPDLSNDINVGIPSMNEISGKYTDDKVGLEIVFPDGWTGIAMGVPEGSMATVSPDGMTSMNDNSFTAMTLMVSEKTKTDSPPKAFDDQGQSKCDEPSVNPTNVSGISATETIMSCTNEDGTVIKLKNISAETATHWVVVSFMAISSDYDKDISKFDDSVKTLKINNSQQSDMDNDGIVDSLDQCPIQSEIINGFEDTDGCPDAIIPKDSDNDGIIDSMDKCPTKVETFNGFEDLDGCPDSKPNNPPQNKVTINVAPGSSSTGCETTADGCYNPKETAMAVGGKVIFSNTDTAAHTFTAGTSSGGPTGEFDSGLVMAGSSFEWTPTTEGTVHYFCMVHPWMAGTIQVGEGTYNPPEPGVDFDLQVIVGNQVYDLLDTATIRLSISGITSPQNVALEISDPRGTTVISRSFMVGSQGTSFDFKIDENFKTGTYKVVGTASDNGTTVTNTAYFKVKSQYNSFKISSVKVTDQQGNPSSLQGGEIGFIKVNLEASKSISTLVTVNLFDYEFTSIGIGSIKTTLASGNSEIILSFMIPGDVSTGESTIYVNAFSDWPSNGGIPLTGEMSIVENIQ